MSWFIVFSVSLCLSMLTNILSRRLRCRERAGDAALDVGAFNR